LASDENDKIKNITKNEWSFWEKQQSYLFFF